ncbi:uncharacterized protein LOC131160067 [Malania oleifera]|uniref:uncharacterized protein LOC131160067 n=1 Tax=Malania oleifera TaxID=397392 RepID=UPI0025ADFD99|nr:uncharacterized protein LOC131160067 [Malania oleifera]
MRSSNSDSQVSHSSSDQEQQHHASSRLLTAGPSDAVKPPLQLRQPTTPSNSSSNSGDPDPPPVTPTTLWKPRGIGWSWPPLSDWSFPAKRETQKDRRVRGVVE